MTPTWPRADLARLIAYVSLLRMITDNDMADAARALFGGCPDACQVHRALHRVERYGVTKEDGNGGGQ